MAVLGILCLHESREFYFFDGTDLQITIVTVTVVVFSLITVVVGV